MHETISGDLDTEILELEKPNSKSGHALNCNFSRKGSQQDGLSSMSFLAFVGKLLRFSAANKTLSSEKQGRTSDSMSKYQYTQRNLVVWKQSGQ